jgi:hypothetical protein
MVDILSAAFLIFFVSIRIFPIYSVIMILLPIYSIAYRWVSRKPGSDLGFICNFIADGEFILWGPLLLLGKII